MDPNIVLRKTRKGLDELKTREHRLPVTLRTVLILVDGKVDVEGLCKKVPALNEMVDTLGILLKEGFIHAGSEDDNSEAGIDSNDVGTAATRAKWEIVEMAGEILGEEFANRATRRFTTVPDTPAALEQALSECCQFIALTIDESKARTVEQKGFEILSKMNQ